MKGQCSDGATTWDAKWVAENQLGLGAETIDAESLIYS